MCANCACMDDTPQELVYSYTEMEDAPAPHRELAKYLAAGLSERDAAASAGVSMQVYRRVMGHEPFARYLAKLSVDMKMAAFESVRSLRAVADKSRKVVEQGLDRVLVQLAQDSLTPSQVLEVIPVALRVLKELADRLPASEGLSLVKTQRVEQRSLVEHTHVTGRDIMALRSQARLVVPADAALPSRGVAAEAESGGIE